MTCLNLTDRWIRTSALDAQARLRQNYCRVRASFGRLNAMYSPE